MLSSRFLKGAMAVASVAVMSACSDLSAPTSSLTPRSLRAGDFIPSPGQVLVGGTPTGSFAGYTADESGRASSEFWDNLSSDDRPLGPSGALHSIATSHCNIGFYATNTIGPLCAFKAAGSTNVASNTYTQYWQDAGTGKDDASAFSFNGIYSYDVKLKAAYSSGTSVVGYFYDVGGSRTFVPFPAGISAKTDFSTTVTITVPGGANWGFYITQAAITESPICGLNTACSDQNTNQHFALFLNTVTGTDYLVGIEDANLDPLWPASSPTNQDSDYQDYIFTVTPRTVVQNQCDFITFGRLVLATSGGDKVVISGNAGGNAPGGGILGEMEISVGGTDYHVHDIETYGPTSNAPLNPASGYGRIITGHSGSHLVELRLVDDPNPGKGEPGTVENDMVYLKIDGNVIVAPQVIDKGNIQLHLNCRGPKD